MYIHIYIHTHIYIFISKLPNALFFCFPAAVVGRSSADAELEKRPAEPGGRAQSLEWVSESFGVYKDFGAAFKHSFAGH